MLFRRLIGAITIGFMALGLGLAANKPASAESGQRQVKSKVSAVYPELAKRLNLAGTVKLQITVEPNGTVKSAKVIGGPPLLIEPAVDAVKKRRYEPASSESTEVVEFKFENSND